jgi:HSP20 family protein
MPAQQTETVSTDTKQHQQSGQERQSPEQSQSRKDDRLARLDSITFLSPFALLHRFFNDDIVNLVGDFGGRPATGSAAQAGDAMTPFVPKVDVVQRGNELVVRADLPGMKPDDLTVQISDSAITISGERLQERVDEQGGVYRAERSYGTFLREIPLPEGAMTDQAKATFKDGVLEITVPAPPEHVSRGRRLEIVRNETSSASDAKKNAARQEGA